MDMTEANSWEDCGFPDIYFRTGYLPWLGLVKALYERRSAVGLQTYIPRVPEYFCRIDIKMIYHCWDFDRALPAGYFINPDKIPSASSPSDCFWTEDSLLLAAAGGVQDDVVTTNSMRWFFLPEFPVKWAIQRYNAINLLRYVPTEYIPQWPYFAYEDLNNTFNFKA